MEKSRVKFMPGSNEYNETTSFVPPADGVEGLPERLKWQATIGGERAIAPLFIIGFFVIFFSLFFAGGEHGSGIIGYQGLLMGLGIGAALWLGAALIWIMVDNYYVLDKQSKRIVIHKGFHFFGTEHTFLEGDQVFAVGLNCHPRRARGSGTIGWIYTPIIFVKDGRELELSGFSTDMNCTKLPEFNDRIEEWASVLQCYCVRCPSGCAFLARDYFGQANVR
ncbi:MAG TPA: hypothetical protein VH251_09300 [Verrucomicrobiae bacterium]|nr:hypothetical protein [Verrucomicrobiae bacterium]